MVVISLTRETSTMVLDWLSSHQAHVSVNGWVTQMPLVTGL